MAEDLRSAPRWRRWVYAAKPASWNKLLVPSVLGQAMGLGAARGLDWLAVALGLGFTVLLLLFIVFLNDWGDREVDAIKRRMFPTECSPKTIPDGLLPAHHLLIAGVCAGVAAWSLALLGAWLLERPWLGAAALVALGVFVAYTLPPIRANYRGGGELLEMIGVGVVLPWMQAYLQGGALLVDGLWLLPGFSLFALASAVASGLADERSDRAGGKRTFVARFGNRWGRLAVEVLTFGGVLVWLVTPSLPFWVTGISAAVVLLDARELRGLSASAVCDAFGAQKRYKACLHRAMWRGANCAAMLLLWRDLT